MLSHLKKKAVAIYGILLLVLVAACMISLASGAAPLPTHDLWQSGIFRLRLTRTVLCVVAGQDYPQQA
jgi:hypothetical protein